MENLKKIEELQVGDVVRCWINEGARDRKILSIREEKDGWFFVSCEKGEWFRDAKGTLFQVL